MFLLCCQVVIVLVSCNCSLIDITWNAEKKTKKTELSIFCKLTLHTLNMQVNLNMQFLIFSETVKHD